MSKERLVELIKEATESTWTFSDLADYLLANGVIVPPCKVGDVVYVLHDKKIYKTRVFSMVAETEDDKWVYILKCEIFNGIRMFKKFLFGKTVFLTREEAEKKLEEGESK